MLAYQLIHGPNESRLDPEVQQSFIDESREPDENEPTPESEDRKDEFFAPVPQEISPTDEFLPTDAEDEGERDDVTTEEERIKRLLELDRSFPDEAQKRGRRNMDLLADAPLPTESRGNAVPTNA